MKLPENWISKEIIFKKTIDLVPYARNSRVHTPEQVNKLRASIREWGFTNPVIIDDKNSIIAGHGRVMAAAAEELEQVPCLVAKDWTEAQKRAYVIADNKLTDTSSFDIEMLKTELLELEEANFDLELMGFDADELADLLGFEADALETMPELKTGDKEPFQQITFTLHDTQVEKVEIAIKIAKKMGAFDTENENSNGNALSRICEIFIMKNND